MAEKQKQKQKPGGDDDEVEPRGLSLATLCQHGDAGGGHGGDGERFRDVSPPLHVATTYRYAPLPGGNDIVVGSSSSGGGMYGGPSGGAAAAGVGGGVHGGDVFDGSFCEELAAAGGSHDAVYGRADQPTRARAERLLGLLELTPGGKKTPTRGSSSPSSGKGETDSSGGDDDDDGDDADDDDVAPSKGAYGHALLYSSGMAAAMALMTHTAPRRLVLEVGYTGTRDVVDQYTKLVCGPMHRRHGEGAPKPPEILTLDELEAELDAADAKRAKQKKQKKQKAAAAAEDEGPQVVGVDLIMVETPRNPDTRLIDVARCARLARRCQPRATLAVDATFASPVSFRPLEHGADFAMHSVTKTLGGHSDLQGGALVTLDPSRYGRLMSERTTSGSSMSAFESWLLLRSLRTLDLRVRRAGETALAVARWLQEQADATAASSAAAAAEGRSDDDDDDVGDDDDDGTKKKGKKHKKDSKKSKKKKDGKGAKDSAAAAAAAAPGPPARVERVWHCFLPSHPDYAMRKAYEVPPYCLSVQLTEARHARNLPSFTRLFISATSLGGTESLVDHRARYDPTMPENLLRLSCGLESPEDLIRDLRQALVAVGRAFPITNK